MVENGKLKITVLKRTDSKQIFGDNPPIGQAIEASACLMKAKNSS